MNFQKMMQEAQKLQNSLKKKQAELEAKDFDFDYKGLVTVKIKGNLEILNITFNPDIIDADDAETLQDVTVKAINEAIKTVQAAKEQITNSIMPGAAGQLF
ncbi:YbaB/EbfC family nucleoid-associated protein [Ureaplasma miroungigenitalium]|uniref:Nucleoid-associated protein OF376_02725 n=1 Tax=Ureaplasma miroungigenitalium TaxID=1042321 RepID=A0ABT3BNE7_9BACT|nr:YbaB/EbfC family nucleoid-associated protein [Ureaplasma miroungigenitalium]MCV3728677.1 YbaB/EbfC family nucleoid-associated protein [Ureaplasma miroungigenitalium]MCV3734368.1 YbaB/EbfC family nucleoid-associated protein [Ureaplasma miroungigenitalium]